MIGHLEDKLDGLKRQYKAVSEQLESIKQDYDYETPKKAAAETLTQIMDVLRAA